MAAQKVIHFSLWAQLGPPQLSPTGIRFGHVISFRFSQPPPTRVVILPNWDMPDEDRYDNEQSSKRKNAAARHPRRQRKSSRKAGVTDHESKHLVTHKKGGSRS